MLINNPEDFYFDCSSGYRTTIRNSWGFEQQAVIPYTCKIKFTGISALSGARYLVRLDVKITQGGLWEITIYD